MKAKSRLHPTRRRSVLSASLAAIVVVPALWAADPAAATTFCAPITSCFGIVIPGHLQDSAGNPLAGVTMIATALPTDDAMAAATTDDILTGVPVGSAVTDANGNYTITFYKQTPGVMATLNPEDNTFNIEIGAQSPTYFSTFDVRINEPGNGSTGPFVPALDGAAPDQTAADWSDVGSGTPGQNFGSLVQNDTGGYTVMMQSPASIPIGGGGGSGGAFNPASYCYYNPGGILGATYVPTWRYNSYFIAPVRVQRVETGAHSYLAYEWKNDRTVTAAIGVEWQLSGVQFTAGMEHSLTVSAGGTFNVGANSYYDLAPNMKFLRYQLGCQGYIGNTALQPIDWTGYYEDRMDYYADANSQFALSKTGLWSCAAKNTGPEIKGDPVFVSQTSTTTFSGGVAFPGLDLESKNINDGSHTLSYNFTADTYLCGNNNVPSSASLIREK